MSSAPISIVADLDKGTSEAPLQLGNWKLYRGYRLLFMNKAAPIAAAPPSNPL
jgi:hypothetical protein